MYRQEEILITGADGLVGSEMKLLYPNAIFISHKSFDLTDVNNIKYMFHLYKPKCVVHLAAKVGGILDNIENPASYFDENLLMNTNLIKYSYLNGVERFIGALSSCIFPDVAEKYPMEIDLLHKGPPTKTNFSYGYAKRVMAVQIEAYNKQYGTKYNYLIPSNMYGRNDKFDMKKGHFIPTLIMKIIKAEMDGTNAITLIGDGSPLRQFMHARDLARVVKYTIDNGIYENLNVANDENLSIKEMAEIALRATNNQHFKINYDISGPNGQHRKDICNKRVKELIPGFEFTKLEEGVLELYNILKGK